MRIVPQLLHSIWLLLWLCFFFLLFARYPSLRLQTSFTCSRGHPCIVVEPVDGAERGDTENDKLALRTQLDLSCLQKSARISTSCSGEYIRTTVKLYNK